MTCWRRGRRRRKKKHILNKIENGIHCTGTVVHFQQYLLSDFKGNFNWIEKSPWISHKNKRRTKKVPSIGQQKCVPHIDIKSLLGLRHSDFGNNVAFFKTKNRKNEFDNLRFNVQNNWRNKNKKVKLLMSSCATDTMRFQQNRQAMRVNTKIHNLMSKQIHLSCFQEIISR